MCGPVCLFLVSLASPLVLALTERRQSMDLARVTPVLQAHQ